MSKNGIVVAGVMSGTSADGINVALVRMGGAGSGGRGRPPHTNTRFELIGHAEYSYPAKVRAAVLAAMNAARTSVADLARLNFLLGELYADAVLKTQARFQVKADLVGCHGQTIYHQGERIMYLGRPVATTWQTGEASIIAARVGVPVVSDFRPADMAAGGKGAPLVPFLDYMLFRDARIGRIVQNIGGIANLTAIPAGASPGDVIAFDTGPGNMVMDAITYKLFGRSYDKNGRFAAGGTVIEAVLKRAMKHGFFRRRPPKTAGREEFGREFATEFIRSCGRARKPDILATATALTASSIVDAVRRFVIKKPGKGIRHPYREMVLSGGGARNATLVAMLIGKLAPLSVQVRFSDEFALPSESKEAVAFAVLAFETWHRRASNVPSATGARREAVLGKVSYP